MFLLRSTVHWNVSLNERKKKRKKERGRKEERNLLNFSTLSIKASIKWKKWGTQTRGTWLPTYSFLTWSSFKKTGSFLHSAVAETLLQTHKEPIQVIPVPLYIWLQKLHSFVLSFLLLTSAKLEWGKIMLGEWRGFKNNRGKIIR